MKDFDAWNKQKKRVNSKEPRQCIEREVWWASLGLNIGNEQDGTGNIYHRPVLVLRVFNNATCFIIPLTTSQTENKYRVYAGKLQGKKVRAAISQLRMIDTRRLNNRMGKLDKDTFETIGKAVKEIL